jgi:hypothetical protein
MNKMKNLFRTTKVIHDAHTHSYDVYYKNFLFWKFDSSYRYDDDIKYPIHYQTKVIAEKEAINRAKAMLETVEVWKQSNSIGWY